MRRTSSQSDAAIRARSVIGGVSDVAILRHVSGHQRVLWQDRLADDRARVAGLDPVPRVEDLVLRVIASLGLDQDGPAENFGLQLLPLLRSDDGDALDVVRVPREELDLFPPRRPLGSGHRRQICENPDRSFSPFPDRPLDLRKKCVEVFGRDAARDLETECFFAAFRKSLDHAPRLLSTRTISQTVSDPARGAGAGDAARATSTATRSAPGEASRSRGGSAAPGGRSAPARAPPGTVPRWRKAPATLPRGKRRIFAAGSRAEPERRREILRSGCREERPIAARGAST